MIDCDHRHPGEEFAAAVAAARRDPSQHYTVVNLVLMSGICLRPTRQADAWVMGVALKFAGTLWSGVGHYPSDAG